jgi:hypothetical protein
MGAREGAEGEKSLERGDSVCCAVCFSLTPDQMVTDIQAKQLVCVFSNWK